MKKILLAAFAGLCVFGALVLGSNNAETPYVSGLNLPDVVMNDTTPPKPDTAKLVLSKPAFSARVLSDTTPPKPDTSKLAVLKPAFNARILSDTTPSKPDTTKLLAYGR